MCQQSQQFVAVTTSATVTVENVNLDGSGTLTHLFTAGSNGSVVKSITIKSFDVNAQGMVRFFIKTPDAEAAILWREVPVPAQTPSPTVAAYQTTIRVSLMLQEGTRLYVTTQNRESWNFIAEAVNWTNCPCEE